MTCKNRTARHHGAGAATLSEASQALSAPEKTDAPKLSEGKNQIDDPVNNLAIGAAGVLRTSGGKADGRHAGMRMQIVYQSPNVTKNRGNAANFHE